MKADAPVSDRGSRRNLEVAHRDMGFPFQFPLDDEPQGGRLHTAHGVGGGVGVTPGDPARSPAYGAIHEHADEGGIHQRLVHFSGGGYGGLHRRFGDLLERHPVQSPEPREQLLQMPGDELALSIRVSCKVEGDRVVLCGLLLDGADGGLAPLGPEPGGLWKLTWPVGPVRFANLFGWVNVTVLGQALNVAAGGQHPPLVFPQVLEEGLALGLGFDEQDVHVRDSRFLLDCRLRW